MCFIDLDFAPRTLASLSMFPSFFDFDKALACDSKFLTGVYCCSIICSYETEDVFGDRWPDVAKSLTPVWSMRLDLELVAVLKPTGTK